jgi:pilus assembly protein CpaF
MMSDVQIPAYVAQAQVASAIDMVVQLSRYSEDGSRRVTRISEVTGLDRVANQYLMSDLFIVKMHGKSDDGKLISQLDPTGELPTFSQEPYEHGMDDKIRLTESLWTR